MLVLLAISTLAAVLLPTPQSHGPATVPSSKAGRGPGSNRPGILTRGLLLVARMRISARPPKTVRIERGDQLRLGVAAPFGSDIEIPGFGLDSPVTRFAPAQFDLLASQTGSFAVRTASSGKL